MTTNATQQPKSFSFIPLNLFDAVPFVAQTHFESTYSTYDDVSFSEIFRGVKEIYHLTGKEFPQEQDTNHQYQVILNMLTNAIYLALDDKETYDENCRVNTIQLNNFHNIGYNS